MKQSCRMHYAVPRITLTVSLVLVGSRELIVNCAFAQSTEDRYVVVDLTKIRTSARGRASGDETAFWAGGEGGVVCLAVSPDGESVAAGAQDGTLTLLDPMTGESLTELEGHESCITGVCYLGESGRLASCDLSGSVIIWGLANGTAELQIAPRSQFFGMCASPDGEMVLCIPMGPQRTDAHVFDTLSGGPIAQISVAEPPGGAIAADWSPDGLQAVTSVVTIVNAEITPQLLFWNTTSWTRMGTFDLPAFASSVAYSPEGKFVACGLQTGEVLILELETHSELERFVVPRKSRDSAVFSVAFDWGASMIAAGVGGRRSSVVVWDFVTGEFVSEFAGHRSGVTSVGFLPDVVTVVSGGRDRTVRSWDTSKPAETRVDSENQKTAESDLQFARLYLQARRFDRAREYAESVLELVPDSELATQAQEILDELP